MQRKIELIAVAVVLGALLLVLYQWQQSHEAAAVAEAQSKVLQSKIAETQKSIDAANEAITKRDQALQQMQQQFAAQIASIRTPAQAQPIILDYARNLPGIPVQAQVDKATGNATYTLTPEQQVQTAKDIATCGENAKELAICQQTESDLKHEVVDITAQREDYKQQSANWEKAAKGGSTWQRVWKVTKYVAIGAAVGYALGKH